MMDRESHWRIIPRAGAGFLDFMKQLKPKQNHWTNKNRTAPCWIKEKGDICAKAYFRPEIFDQKQRHNMSQCIIWLCRLLCKLIPVINLVGATELITRMMDGSTENREQVCSDGRILGLIGPAAAHNGLSIQGRVQADPMSGSPWCTLEQRNGMAEVQDVKSVSCRANLDKQNTSSCQTLWNTSAEFSEPPAELVAEFAPFACALALSITWTGWSSVSLACLYSNQPKSKPQILCLQVTLASAEPAKLRSPAQLADGHIWTFLADRKTQDTQLGSGQIATDLQDPTSLWVIQCETWSSKNTLRLKIHQAFPISKCHMIQHKPCTPPCQGGTWEHWCSSCPAPGRSGPWAIRSLG